MQLFNSKPLYSGKVADLYHLISDTGEECILLVRSDNISGLNVKMSNPMPFKGAVLNQLSQYWLNNILKGMISNHLVDDTEGFFDNKENKKFINRSVIVKKLKPLKVEAIVRGYLVGTGYDAYIKTGKVCGVELPLGLEKGDKLVNPIFTPTEKTETDDHFTFTEMSELIGKDLSEQIREVSLKMFVLASAILYDKGIILVDTKFEFGLDSDGNLVLMDEVLTPDSSRFWLRDAYEEDGTVISLDKQKARDWLEKQKESGEWDGESSIELPVQLLNEISRDYIEIFKTITGISPLLD